MGQLVYPANAQPVYSSKAYASPEMVPHPLGTIGRDHWGREYRFVLNSSAGALVVGNALQAQAQIASHQDTTPDAAAIGDTSIALTPSGSATGAADLYADGIAVVDTTPGLGYSYPIKTHLAIAASTKFTIQLAAGWKVQVALTNAQSRVSLYPNPYRNVVQSPVTTVTNTPVGVCQYPLAASEYGWIGFRGQFGTLIQGTPAVGNLVAVPASAAGAVAIQSSTLAVVGIMMDTGQDGKVEGVSWLL